MKDTKTPEDSGSSKPLHRTSDLTLPPEIAILVERCKVDEAAFDNADMSLALKFGELLWRRLARMAEHYERMSTQFVEQDIRGPLMSQSAKDMRHVLGDVKKDL